jgi:hypothetical protein
MNSLTFWKMITLDNTNLLDRLIKVLKENGIQFCVIGVQSVNTYVEPLVSLDLDLALAIDQIERVEELFKEESFTVKHFPHSLNIALAGSDLRVQIQTDPRYADFVKRATDREVLGITLPVASLKDVLQGKIWDAQDPERRGSKRQKDLADIARLIEAFPYLKSRVPEEIQARLL